MRMAHKIFTLAIVTLAITTNAQGEFPRNDGKHFTFETNWGNNLEIDQFSETPLKSEFNFSVHNLDSPGYIQFKRLALDSNTCYLNQSWNITVNLYFKEDLGTTTYIGDTRTERIPVEPDIKYRIETIIAFDEDTITEGTHSIIIQMNLITESEDSPHYFFTAIDFDRITPQAKPWIPTHILIVGVLTFLGIIVVQYWKHKVKKEIKNKEVEK